MKSKMSFFNPTLLKKNIGRFAPAWALLLVVLFLSVSQFLVFEFTETPPITLGGMRSFGAIAAFVCAIVFATLLFRYLHNTGAGYAMHAFPMTRSCLFVTNLISGLLFYLVPVFVTFLSYVGITGAEESFAYTGLILSLMLEWALQYLCFYGIAVFVMFLTGRTVIAVLSYFALNFLFFVLPLLTLSLVGNFFLGFYCHVNSSVKALSPLLGMLASRAEAFSVSVWIYAAIGLLLLPLSWLLYRHRHVERAGDAMAYGWAQAAFRVIFTVSVALCLGWALTELSDKRFTLLYVLFGCFLGWFGAALMVERVIKVFKHKKTWLGFVVFAAVLVLPIIGLKLDLLGTQRRVPETAKVESVDIWTHDYVTEVFYIPSESDRITLTAPADIDLIRGVHQNILENNGVGNGDENLVRFEEDDFEAYYYGKDTIYIRYHLAGGGTLTRAYSGQQVPDEEVRKLTALYRRPDVLQAWYANALPTEYEEVSLVYYEVKDVPDIDSEEAESLREEDGWYLESINEGRMVYKKRVSLTCKNPAALRGAILADAAAGHTFVAMGSNLTGNVWDVDSADRMQLWFKKKGKFDEDSYESPYVIFYVDKDAEDIFACFR
jgi:ABC-2 type transport system permease protein